MVAPLGTSMTYERISPTTALTAPKVEKPETLHFILRVTDKGRPPLSRYERVIVTVTP